MKLGVTEFELTPEQEEQLALCIRELVQAQLVFGALYRNDKGELKINKRRSKLFDRLLNEEDNFLRRVFAEDYCQLSKE